MCIRDSIEGVDVIKKIRTWSNVPIIVISARSEDTDKIDALDAVSYTHLDVYKRQVLQQTSNPAS